MSVVAQSTQNDILATIPVAYMIGANGSVRLCEGRR
eukprot:COSAG02_NODE_54608_length_295_cov_0.775510_1_plen_35_part_10